jgi:hypothetical protein
MTDIHQDLTPSRDETYITDLACYGLRARRLLKLDLLVGAIDAFGNCARRRRAMSPTGLSKAIADSITAAAVRR